MEDVKLEETLEVEEVETVIKNVLNNLSTKLGAVLR